MFEVEPQITVSLYKNSQNICSLKKSELIALSRIVMQLPDCLLLASHDTHVFRLAEPLNETIILDKLDYPINMWGAENGETTSHLIYCNGNKPVGIQND